MPRVTREPDGVHRGVIEMRPTSPTARTDAARRGQRGQRSASARSRPVLLPRWPAGDESEQGQATTHAETRGALALLDHPETRAERRAAAAHRRILVVEDDALMATLIRAGLELEGERDWVVQSASEGFHALELAGATPPDVVLLDVRLPGLNGAEVYRRLRSGSSTRHARVLFLSAGTSYDLHLLGIEDGVLLRKPFDVRELVGLVRALLVG